jgi:signal transduction histidine kinase
VERPWWYWAAAALVVGAGGVLAASAPWFEPRGQLALLASTATAAAATAAVTWGRYRDTHDPHLLWISVGAAVLGVQLVGYGVAWPLRHEPPAAAQAPTPLPVLSWQVGWVVAAGCLALALAWRDRRGRPPVRPARVVAIAALGLGTLQVAALLGAAALRDDATWRDLQGGTFPSDARFALGALGWVLGGTTVALLLVAAFRESSGRGAASGSLHQWVAGACLLAIPPQLGTLVHPGQGLGWVGWSDAFQPLVPATLLAGLLVTQRGAFSRMRRATDRAQEVMGGRAEIASMVAHEVRGPVSTIKGLAATTAGNYERLSDEERKEFVGLIRQEASRLLDVVDHTSLALQVDAGTLSFERRLHELAAVVQEATETADLRDRPVELDLAPGLRSKIDRRWLLLAIRLVLDNAARFSPEGTPIGVRLHAEGADALIDVTDHGPGVPPERRDEVFTKFVTWRPTGYEDRPGSGLGLFICRGILTGHAGDSSFVNHPGGGTMLRLRLPTEG